MVTAYMKNEDIAAEFRRDWNSNLFDRIVGIMNDAKYRKYILKNVTHYFTHFDSFDTV